MAGIACETQGRFFELPYSTIQVVVACPAHTYLFDPIVGTCLWDPV